MKAKRKILVIGVTLLIIGLLPPMITADTQDAIIDNTIYRKIKGTVDSSIPVWAYYKIISISNKVKNYGLMLNVTKYSGGNITCEGHCQDDFGDIRFFSPDNVTELPYWLEYYEPGDFAIFWVNNSQNDSHILIYYNAKPTKETTSDGDSTFIFFDDFEDEEIDWDKWDDMYEAHGDNGYGTSTDRSYRGNRAVHATYFDGGGLGINHTMDTPMNNITIECAFYDCKEHTFPYTDNQRFSIRNNGDGFYSWIHLAESLENYLYRYAYYDTAQRYSTISRTIGWHTVKCNFAAYPTWWIDNDLVSTDNTKLDPDNFYKIFLYFSTVSLVDDYWFDTVRVRMYRHPAPYWSGFGNEQPTEPL